MDEKQLKIMKDLPNDAFLLEYKNMTSEVEERTKKLAHMEDIQVRTQKYYDLTKRVQEEIRKDPQRIEPDFKFEKRAEWQEANMALMEHQHETELLKISNELDNIQMQIDATNKEIALQSDAVVEFEKEKTKRGI
jgi:hypothetical protein